MSGRVCLPISADLYNEFILRAGKSVDVADWIENIARDYLDRTREDHGWSKEHYERVAEEDEREASVARAYGPSHKGYYWQNVFLPNRTRLRMTYRRQEHFAEVRHKQVIYQDEPCSPSEFASRVANNTNRNAWRDIWLLRPNDEEWIFADTARADAMRRNAR